MLDLVGNPKDRFSHVAVQMTDRIQCADKVCINNNLNRCPVYFRKLGTGINV